MKVSINFLNIRLTAFLVTILLSLCLNACQKKEQASTEICQPCKDASIISLPPDTLKSIDVQYDEAKYRLVDSVVKTNGEVLANSNLNTKVTSTVTGRVIKVLANIGDHVQNGQILLLIRSQDIEQTESDLLQAKAQVLADLKSNLIQIDSDISSGKAQLKYSESSFKRMESLVSEKIASRAEYEAAKTQFDKDQITLDTLYTKRDATISLSHQKLYLQTEPIKQKLKLLGVNNNQIKHLLETDIINPIVTIQAPQTGIVIQRDVNLNELIDPSKILFTIGNFNTVWLKADVYEKDISSVQVGQPIQLDVDSFPDEVFYGKLNYVADSVNQDTRTLQVRAEVENPGNKLKPKMYARMKICVGEKEKLTIPKSAIQEADSDKVVYMPLGNGKFKEQKIITGSEYGEMVNVISGLKSGDKVVTKGSFELRSETLKES